MALSCLLLLVAAAACRRGVRVTYLLLFLQKQLALLSCFIKGAAAYADLMVGTGQGIILMDPSGTP